MGVGVQLHDSAALSQGKTSVPIVRDTGWGPGPFRTVWRRYNFLTPLRFELLTLQLVVGRYSNRTILAPGNAW